MVQSWYFGIQCHNRKKINVGECSSTRW
jgi:hypothetical protein